MSHSPTKDWRWPETSVQDETDLVVMRSNVALAREAIEKRDWEVAHYHEDQGHMLVVRRAAEGRDVRALAEMLLPLCETEYPRNCA